MLLPIAWLIGCESGKEPAETEPDTAACVDCGEETAPPDTAEPEDTADTAPEETGDSAVDSADTAEDTAEPPPCTSALLTREDGSVFDMTQIFTIGDYYTLSEPGTLEFCPGVWFVRLVVEADLAIVGLGQTREDTTLSGGEQGAVISVYGPAKSSIAVSIANVTIDRGSSLVPGDNAYGGGGVRCRNDGVLTIENALFSNNKGYDGGGLYIHGCDATVTDTDFVANFAEDDGGAVGLYYGEVSFRDVLFQDNVSADGGGIMNYYATVEIEDSVFQGNYASYDGGALGNYYGEIDVDSSVFLDNVADFYGGAAVAYGDTIFEGCRFEGNSIGLAVGSGGALSYGGGGTLVGDACDFVGNTPNDLYAFGQPPLALGKGAAFLCDSQGCVEK